MMLSYIWNLLKLLPGQALRLEIAVGGTCWCYHVVGQSDAALKVSKYEDGNDMPGDIDNLRCDVEVRVWTEPCLQALCSQAAGTAAAAPTGGSREEE